MTVDDDDSLVRALHEPFWDEKQKRASKSAFMQTDVSVSRLSVLPYEHILMIFQRDLNAAGTNGMAGRRVGATATVKTGFVRTQCAANTSAEVVVDIVEDPIIGIPNQMDNPAHALIQGRDRSTQMKPKMITAGMANSILRGCLIRVVES